MDGSKFGVRIATGIAALAAAVGIGVNAHASFAGGVPSLTQSGVTCSSTGSAERCVSPFAGASNLAPGGAPAAGNVVLTYNGSRATDTVGLYLTGFATRAAASSAACTAADPASMFDFTLSANGRQLYSGSLADFAAKHFDPASRLSLPGRSGSLDRWAPGDTVTVRMTVGLDRAAGNEYMGCATQADFAWFAQ